MQNLLKNIFFEYILLIYKIFFQIFFAPLMIYFWGKENFSLWILIFSIPNLISTLNITGVDALKNKLTILYRSNKLKEIKQYHFNMLVILILTIFVLTLIYLVFYNLKNELINKNLYLINLTFVSVMINLINDINYCKLTYRGNHKIWIKYEIIFDLTANSLIIFLGIFYNNILYACLIFLIINITKFIFYYFFIKDKIIKSKIGLHLFSLKKIIEIIKFSTGMGLENCSNIIKNSGLILVTSLKLSLDSVGTLNTAKTLFYFLIVRIFSAILKPLRTEITLIQKNNTLMKKYYIKYNYLLIIIILLLLIISLFSYFAGENIYNFWLNGSYYISKSLIILILIDSSFVVLGNFFTAIFKALNKFFLISLIDLIFNLSLVLFIYLSKVNNLIDIFKIIILFGLLNTLTKLTFYVFRKI